MIFSLPPTSCFSSAPFTYSLFVFPIEKNLGFSLVSYFFHIFFFFSLCYFMCHCQTTLNVKSSSTIFFGFIYTLDQHLHCLIFLLHLLFLIHLLKKNMVKVFPAPRLPWLESRCKNNRSSYF